MNPPQKKSLRLLRARMGLRESLPAMVGVASFASIKSAAVPCRPPPHFEAFP